MMYSKQQQIGKRSKPKRKNRTEIKERDRKKALDYWGSQCLFCESPNIALHHVMYRSTAGEIGKGRWRNLLPLCQYHHDIAHKDKDIRRTLEWKLEYTFGQFYWCDEFDLYDKGLIEHPTVSEYERYFEGVE